MLTLQTQDPKTLFNALQKPGTLVPDCSDFIRATCCDNLNQFVVFSAPPQASDDLAYTASVFMALYDFHDPCSLFHRSLGKMPVNTLLADTRCSDYVLVLDLGDLSDCTSVADLPKTFADILKWSVEKFRKYYSVCLEFSSVKVNAKDPVAPINQILVRALL